MPRLLHDAKKIRRLMGLSKPRPSRKVDKMKRMPSKEKMEATLSVTDMALIWRGVAVTVILAGVHLDQLDSLKMSIQGFRTKREKLWAGK